jgi:replication factor C small subunit
MSDNVFAEKYRPKTLDDIVGQEEIVSLLKAYVKNRKIPHMLFSGMQGTGKTASAQALARDFYGKDWNKYFYAMNASDARKLEDIRNSVKTYAQSGSLDQDFKVIFMDEADSMDFRAQPALRAIIEKYSDRCRFIISCNYPNKIIEPIKDRCVSFRFKPLKPEQMKKLINKIRENESIDISDDAIDVLCELSKGSLRRAIGVLEKLHAGNVTNISKKTIYDNFCYIDDDDIRKLIKKIARGDISASSLFIEDLLYEKGYEYREIIESLERLLRESKILSPIDIANAIEMLGEFEFRVSVGASPEIQLKTYIVHLYKLYKNYAVV